MRSLAPVTSPSNSCAQSVLLSRGRSRFLWPPVVVMRPRGSGHPSSTPASRRTRRLPRMRFAASLGTPRAMRSFLPHDNWNAQSKRRDAVDAPPPGLRRSQAGDDRTSTRQARKRECARLDPMVAYARRYATEMPRETLLSFSSRSQRFALSTYFPTLNFALSTFSGGFPCPAPRGYLR